VIIPCDDVILAIGQDNAFPWIERDIGLEFDPKWDMPIVDKVTHQSTRPASSSAAMPRGGRRTSSGRSRTDTQAAISIDRTARASRSASARRSA
jgi:formate dehydrogenase beta subunit